MRIIIVDCYGQYRSTGAITSIQYTQLKMMGHDVKVCYRGIKEPPISNPDYIKIAGKIEPYFSGFMSSLTGLLDGTFNYFSTRRLKKITESFKPDIIQLNILHGFFIDSIDYINYLKNKGIPIVFSMFDESAYLGICPFALDCKQFISKCTYCPPSVNHTLKYKLSWFFNHPEIAFHSKLDAYKDLKAVFCGTQWVVERAKQSALLKGHRIEILDEPINYTLYNYPHNNNAIKVKLGIPANNKVVVTVTSLKDKRKGGYHFYQVADMLKDKDDITFLYVGVNCEEPCHPKNLKSFGYLSSKEELAEFYSVGDCFIWTGYFDTVPDACLEALGCGTPIIAFPETGSKYIAPAHLAKMVPTGNIKALAKEIVNTPIKNEKRIKECRNYALSRYNESVVIKKLESIYQSLV